MTDGPNESLLGVEDTPGPEATPEQEAFVASLLVGLRDDDPPMPDDVVRRISAVLAEERRSPVAGAGSGPTAGLADAPDSPTDAALPTNVSVLPMRSDRPSAMTRSFRVLGGVAAAAVLVVGGYAIANGGLGGSGATTAGSATDAAVASYQVRDSGTAYTKSALSTQVSSLVAQVPEARRGASVAPEVEATGDAPSPVTSQSEAPVTPATSTPAGGGVATLFSAAEVPSCLAGLERSGGRPLLVDVGTYAAKSAAVIVLATPEDTTSLDVYVVALPCTVSSADILTFQRLPRP